MEQKSNDLQNVKFQNSLGNSNLNENSNNAVTNQDVRTNSNNENNNNNQASNPALNGANSFPHVSKANENANNVINNQEVSSKNNIENNNTNQANSPAFGDVNNFQNALKKNENTNVDASQDASKINVENNINHADNPIVGNINNLQNAQSFANSNQNSNISNEQSVNIKKDKIDGNNPAVDHNQKSPDQTHNDSPNAQDTTKHNADPLLIEDNQHINPTPPKLNPEALIVNSLLHNDQQQSQTQLESQQSNQNNPESQIGNPADTQKSNSLPNEGNSPPANMGDSLNVPKLTDTNAENKNEISLNEKQNLNTLNVNKRDLRMQEEENSQELIRNTEINNNAPILNHLNEHINSNDPSQSQINPISANSFDKTEIQVNSKDVPENFIPKTEDVKFQNSQQDVPGERNLENRQINDGVDSKLNIYSQNGMGKNDFKLSFLILLVDRFRQLLSKISFSQSKLTKSENSISFTLMLLLKNFFLFMQVSTMPLVAIAKEVIKFTSFQ